DDVISDAPVPGLIPIFEHKRCDFTQLIMAEIALISFTAKTVLPNEREMAVGAFNFNKTRHKTYIGMKSIFVSMGLSLSTHLAHYPH
ncbi:hypothetical protein, partial [Endozoicomonas sp.]|uniref:hypothetical protein n=1 Tax=Endozoicomonas sp. TaxID=1892382 RepID=UPI00383BE14B